MIIILIRTSILYITMLFVIRVMGKGELSSMDPFQMVVLIMIAELAALPIESPDISIVTGVGSLFTLLFLQVLFSFLTLKSERFKTLLNGKPSVLIDQGKINRKEMDNLRISIDDLTEQLRLKSYPSIADVEYAVLEVNGDLSVIPTHRKKTVTLEDLSLPAPHEKLPAVLIADGSFYAANLSRLSMNEAMFKAKLLKLGIDSYDQVFLCFSDENGKLHVYGKNASSKEDLLQVKSEETKGGRPN